MAHYAIALHAHLSRLVCRWRPPPPPPLPPPPPPPPPLVVIYAVRKACARLWARPSPCAIRARSLFTLLVLMSLETHSPVWAAHQWCFPSRLGAGLHAGAVWQHQQCVRSLCSSAPTLGRCVGIGGAHFVALPCSTGTGRVSSEGSMVPAVVAASTHTRARNPTYTAVTYSRTWSL
jgi:hypothetical protein